MTWSIGSTWLRWDPHIHAPGTLKGNHYGPHGDAQVWDRYFEKLRTTMPACAAIGITDYFVPRGYRLFLQHGGQEKLPGVFAFPNVELRLRTRTQKGHALNVHLLVAPNESDHLSVLVSTLAALTFHYDGNDYQCTEEGLRRLGRCVRRGAEIDDEAALRVGATQFLVSDEQFANLKGQAWVRKNVLFAVAAGNDGLAGMKGDAFKSFREELGRIADIVFSGSSSERRYWLGDHPDAEDRISGVKPCLHGSDAHGFDGMLSPAKDRRCWIRGSATFDGLRQTLIEPRRRVHIGPAPDDTRSPSNVIRALKLRNAPWFTPTEFLFNDGLVTIIGARGSGKTALADLIALAAGARDQKPSAASFLHRAEALLGDMEVELEWADGTTTPVRKVSDWASDQPRVRYLSQQFVEHLSQRELQAGQGQTWNEEDARSVRDPLIEEIERVVFEAISVEDRMETDSFSSLRDAWLGVHLETREAERALIGRNTRAIADEHVKKRSITALKTACDEATRARKAIEKELKSLRMTASKEHTKAYEDAFATHKLLQDAVQKQAARVQRLKALCSALERQQARMDEEHLALSIRYANLEFAPDAWETLRPKIDRVAIANLSSLVVAARGDEQKLRNSGTTQPLSEKASPAGLTVLATREKAAQKILGEDDARSKRRAKLVKNLAIARTREEKAKKDHANSEGAAKRIASSHDARFQAYERLVQTLDTEVIALNDLYEPLKERLASDERLRPLTFDVLRRVDFAAWVVAGERIFDLRRSPFRGRRGFLDAARPVLEQPWQTGSAAEVCDAVKEFMDKYLKDPASLLLRGATMFELGRWLFSTDHISVQYSIKYEGRDIARLSPGARGVVLLTLFLAIDRHDVRPLLIDQPEENLDPKSINGLLVPFFVEAAQRRQIIMVTHNANLVVNADADQVIVATSERTQATELPKFGYEAGGLEDPRIRTLVCQYLEGGEDAFRRRAERYGELVRRRRTARSS